MSPRRTAEIGNGKWEMGTTTLFKRPFPISHFLFPLLLSGCAWFTDFKQQPKVDPWESVADSIPPRANPQGSVPIYGSAAPGFAYGRAMTIGAVDSMSAISNPIPMDEESLRRGGQLYSINCSVCHGNLGAGDGPVTKFRLPVLPIGAGTSRHPIDRARPRTFAHCRLLPSSMANNGRRRHLPVSLCFGLSL